ncbi:hypothetical protein L0244_38235, partial [bacterium]|nr:hypothetical protein [bacterium]
MKKDFYRSDKANTSKGFYGESKRRINLIPILLILVVLALLTAIILSWPRWEGKPPEVRLNKDFKTLGRKPEISITVQDSGSGLKNFSVTLTQKNQAVPLVDEQYAGPGWKKFWKKGDRQTKTFQLGDLISAKYKIQDGPATLQISAVDYSLRHFFHGNSVELQKDFVFDLYPPRLEVLSGQHYINQGGSECVLYRVSSDAVVSGVQAGPNFFPGYAVNGTDKDLKFALFAFAYYMDAKAPLKVVARDEAGNQAIAGFWYKLFPKKFR